MRATPELNSVRWRKSSHSNTDGGNCVEVAELGAVRWRKSSYSNTDGGDCVEIADGVPALVPVRDSKAAPHGPALVFPAGAWGSFVTQVKRDH
jgi:Domain of unknown function (DUF397)